MEKFLAPLPMVYIFLSLFVLLGCVLMLMTSKPKSSFPHLKRGIQDFHMNYVLVPADKAANNVVVV